MMRASVAPGRAGLVLAALAGLAALSIDARADTVASIDWAKGMVVAHGLGVANRHAPSPAAARDPARRAAEDAARKKLATAVGTVPLAGGGTLAAKLADAGVKARVERAVAAALVIDAEPETDGSWTVTMGVPLEALRQALATPREVAASDGGAPVIVIDGVTASPALDYTVDKLAAATLWVPRAQLPAWAASAPHVKARSSKGGAIVTDAPAGSTGSAATSATAATPATLFVIAR